MHGRLQSLRGAKSKVCKGTSGLPHPAIIIIRANEKAEDSVNPCTTFLPIVTFQPSVAHLLIHKNGVISSMLIGWVGGCGRVCGWPNLCIVVYVKIKTMAEEEEFTKLPRLYSEDKK